MKKIMTIILTVIIITTGAFAIDASGANAPEVYQGLYPIKYDIGGNPVFTTASDPEWYSYSQGRWANAVTLDKQGQMNPAAATIDNITGYYVWIPRYAYLIRTGYNSSDIGRIDIRFLNGTTNTDKTGKEYFTIDNIENNADNLKLQNVVTYIGDRQMDYLVHPAFNFEEELTGIWVGKNEMSLNKADVNRDGKIDDNDYSILQNFSLGAGYSKTADINKDGVVDGKDVGAWIPLNVNGVEKHTSINEAFEETRNMISKSEKYDIYNLYGLAEDTNTHLIKPTEYGAVVYLANSIYEPTELYKVHGMDNKKEYLAGGLAGSTGIALDKYVDKYTKDEDGNIVDIKGSAYLETSNGTTAWNNELAVGNGLDYSAGVIVKEGQYGGIADNGEPKGIAYRVVLTKGSNVNNIKQMVSSSASYYWLMENGEVWAMGNNAYGKLGLGDTAYRYMPEKLEVDAEGNKLPAIKQIIAIGSSTWYISKAGDLYACGYNTSGQLGIGNTTNQTLAVKVNALEGVVIKEIMTSGSSTWYISEEGEVYACGDNWSGQLGIESMENQTVPTKVSALEGVKIKDITSAEASTFYLSEDGEVYVCGQNWWGQLGLGTWDNPTTPVKISALEGVKIKDVISTSSGDPGDTWYLSEDGEVYGCGMNHYGQLGLGNQDSQSAAVKISALEGIVIKEIIAKGYSYYSTWYLSDEGDVYVCGQNNYGQLGLGHMTDQSTAVKVSGLEGVTIKEIITNGNSTWYLSDEGEVYVCGANGSGQLGLGHTTNQAMAVKINALEGLIIRKINYISASEIYYIAEDGTSYSIDSNGNLFINSKVNGDIFNFKKLDVEIEKIITDGDSTFYISEEGKLYASGRNSGGELGLGNKTHQTTAIKVTALEGVETKDIIKGRFLSENGQVYVKDSTGALSGILEGIAIKEIITDGFGSGKFYLTENGEVYVSGRNNYGQLGLGNYTDQTTEVKVKALEGVKIKKIIASVANDDYNTWYLSEEGEVYVSGKNNYGVLGEGNASKKNKAVKVSALEGAVIKDIKIAISSSAWYLSEEGKVYVSGRNNYGVLGVGNMTNQNKAVKVSALDGVVIKEIITNGFSAFYLSEEGEVYVSGRNNYGQLGIGNMTDQKTAVKVDVLEGVVIKKIISNGYSTFYISEEGKVYACGQNNYGQLGLGNTTNQSTAVKVSALDGVVIKDIIRGANGYSRWYLSEDGEVYACGENNYGQLGLGNTTDQSTAVKVSAIEGVAVKEIIVSNDGDSIFYLSENGEVYVSGRNASGQLGVGNTKNQTTAVKISALEGVVVKEIIVKGTSYFAVYYLSENGEVYVSGNNSYGQLGVGHSYSQSKPIPVLVRDNTYSTLGNVTSIYGNSTSTVFEEENGDIYVVGDNTNNKLGTNGEIEAVTKLEIRDIKDVGIGNDFSVFLKDDGSIVGYGNVSKTGNGLTGISQIAVQKENAYFMKADGTVMDNQKNTITTGAHKIAAGDSHLVILKKDGTTDVIGQVNSGLTNIVDIFAGKNMTVYITADGKIHMMTDTELTQLSIAEIVYAELNGSKPYFITYDRELIDKDGNTITVLGENIALAKEVKGNKLLTERMKVYPLFE